jgi:FtsH ternary system-associated peptide
MTRTAAPPTQPAEPDGPRQVSKFEFNLLRILRFLVGHSPPDQGFALLRGAIARQECLSAGAVELVEDTLAKACVLFLVRQGGWRNEKYLRAGAPVPGRVWERIPLDEWALSFSPAVVDFLMWATAEKVADTKVAWDAAAKSLTPADELFFWMALDAIRSDPEVLAALRKKNAFRNNLLGWISFPGDMTDSDEPKPPEFVPLFSGLRAVFLECLQSHLAQRWTRSERMKGQIGDWKRMRHQGRAEFAALQGFLQAAAEASRTDLARFVLKTNAALFTAEMTPVFWTGGLQGSGPPRLADRLDTQRAALAVPRQMETLANWQRRSLGIGYFDEDYQASQMWKSDWEAAEGDGIAARARATIEMLEPLHAPAASGPAAAEGGRQATEKPADRPG